MTRTKEVELRDLKEGDEITLTRTAKGKVIRIETGTQEVFIEPEGGRRMWLSTTDRPGSIATITVKEPTPAELFESWPVGTVFKFVNPTGFNPKRIKIGSRRYAIAGDTYTYRFSAQENPVELWED